MKGDGYRPHPDPPLDPMGWEVGGDNAPAKPKSPMVLDPWLAPPSTADCENRSRHNKQGHAHGRHGRCNEIAMRKAFTKHTQA